MVSHLVDDGIHGEPGQGVVVHAPDLPHQCTKILPGGAEEKEANPNRVYHARGKMLAASGYSLPGVVWINWRELLHNPIKTRCLLGLLGWRQAGCGHGYGGSLHHPHRWHGKVLRLRWAWQGSHHPDHYSAIKQKHKQQHQASCEESFLYF